MAAEVYALLPDYAKAMVSVRSVFKSGPPFQFTTEDGTLTVDEAFLRASPPAGHVRFKESQIDRSDGGWLYVLDDGSFVIGVSLFDDKNSGNVKRALGLMLGLPLPMLAWGDQPPPATRREFLTHA